MSSQQSQKIRSFINTIQMQFLQFPASPRDPPFQEKLKSCNCSRVQNGVKNKPWRSISLAPDILQAAKTTQMKIMRCNKLERNKKKLEEQFAVSIC